MKLAPSALGAEPKKVALLGGLILLLVIVLWVEYRPDSPGVSANVTPVTTTAPVQALPAPAAPAPVTSPAPAPLVSGRTSQAGAEAELERPPLGTSSGTDNFVPSLKKNDDIDLSKVDPRIHLELLAKVRAVPLEGGSSSLFDFSKPPEAALPKVEIKPAPPAVPVPPPPPKPQVAKQTQPPPPPPIPFKYYGYAGKSAADAPLEGLFLEGDPLNGNLYAKREGDVIKDRYKIVRLSLRSVVVEDTVTHNQQTVKIVAEQQ